MQRTRRQLCVSSAVVGSALVSGCLGGIRESTPDDSVTDTDGWTWTGSLPVSSLQQYHDADCGCCDDYVAYLEAHGFDVSVDLVDDIAAVKTDLEIPNEVRSCHTTVVGEYLVEGHVPLEAVEALFDDEPSVLGISIPGMPQHAPGMGEPTADPLDIYTFDGDGTTEAYMTL
ncbi:metal-binding protein [Natronolimnobius sp. AArcel1]|uniref:DUF411 domain-containing protein n=1 Tax=Natronolimnobius sp. AArcel1 TaxID=1679093 RepID=UPI0013EE101F|nr:DUF411 domain-containing protein [Natronolimnobius sp. AArcel1]NGM70690.1 metal-binding protein [Natronolimnobius sp. AArcel1]